MFDVRWTDRAEAELASAWLNAADPNAVTRAAERIEYLLKHDPMAQGESRSGNERIVYEVPLEVIYRVLPAAHIVWVVTLRLFP